MQEKLEKDYVACTQKYTYFYFPLQIFVFIAILKMKQFTKGRFITNQEVLITSLIESLTCKRAIFQQQAESCMPSHHR